jgi:hypothetical protein
VAGKRALCRQENTRGTSAEGGNLGSAYRLGVAAHLDLEGRSHRSGLWAGLTFQADDTLQSDGSRLRHHFAARDHQTGRGGSLRAQRLQRQEAGLPPRTKNGTLRKHPIFAKLQELEKKFPVQATGAGLPFLLRGKRRPWGWEANSIQTYALASTSNMLKTEGILSCTWFVVAPWKDG